MFYFLFPCPQLKRGDNKLSRNRRRISSDDSFSSIEGEKKNFANRNTLKRKKPQRVYINRVYDVFLTELNKWGLRFQKTILCKTQKIVSFLFGVWLMRVLSATRLGQYQILSFQTSDFIWCLESICLRQHWFAKSTTQCKSRTRISICLTWA